MKSESELPCRFPINTLMTFSWIVNSSFSEPRDVVITASIVIKSLLKFSTVGTSSRAVGVANTSVKLCTSSVERFCRNIFFLS